MYLFFSFLFILFFIVIFHNRSNFILIFLYIETCFILFIILFCFLSISYNYILYEILCLWLIGIAGVEASIGFLLLINYNIYLNTFNIKNT